MYIPALPSSNSHYTLAARAVAERVVAAVPVAANTGQHGCFVRRRDRPAEAVRRIKGPLLGRQRQCEIGHPHHVPVAVTIGHDGYLRGPVLGGPNWEMKS